MKLLGIFLLTFVLVIVAILMILTWTGVIVGAANAWILQGTFGAGWHAVWSRPLISFGWALLFLGGGILGGHR